MSKEYNLISDFDYRIIAAFFAGLDRQGPGDDAPLARHFVERLEEEIEQYRRYGRRYGYVFYIGQRTE